MAGGGEAGLDQNVAVHAGHPRGSFPRIATGLAAFSVRCTQSQRTNEINFAIGP